MSVFFLFRTAIYVMNRITERIRDQTDKWKRMPRCIAEHSDAWIHKLAGVIASAADNDAAGPFREAFIR